MMFAIECFAHMKSIICIAKNVRKHFVKIAGLSDCMKTKSRPNAIFVVIAMLNP